MTLNMILLAALVSQAAAPAMQPLPCTHGDAQHAWTAVCRAAYQRTGVSGTWDAHFSGTVQDKGTSQTDDFVIELEQNESTVTGMLRIPRHGLSFPLSGEVQGTTFTYTVKGDLGPTCEVTVVAETTFDAAAGRLSGTQTQSTCEGTAVGEVTAVRR